MKKTTVRRLAVALAAAALFLATKRVSADPPAGAPTVAPPAAPAPGLRLEVRVADLLGEIERLEDARSLGDGKLVAMLGCSDARVRARAVLALGRLQDKSTAAALAPLLADSDPGVVEATLFALGQLGDAASVPALRPFLQNPWSPLRALAVEALGRVGAAAETSALVADPDPAVRAEVASSWIRSRALPGPAVLDRLLRDAVPDVRWRAACAATRVDARAAFKSLLGACGDRDPLVRLYAVRGIARADQDEGLPALLAAAADPSDEVVYEAVVGLGTRPAEDATRALATALRRPLFAVRAAAVEALGKRGFDGVAALLDDPSPTVRAAALVAAARVRGASMALRIQAAAAPGEHPALRRAAVQATRVLAGADPVPALEPLFRSGDAVVRTAVLEALEGLDGEAPVPLILAGLRDPDLAVRGTAVGLLEGRKEPRFIPPLVDAFRASGGREFYELREEILATLEKLGLADGVALAEEALRDSYLSVRLQAAKTLKALAKREVALPPAGPPDPRPAVRSFARPPRVAIDTPRGRIVVECFPDDAPVHVSRFIDRVEKGFYRRLTFHRVVPNFVVQGGDPRGDGWGDGGETVRDEINRRRFEPGAVGMPKAGKDTGGCQLFLTHLATPHLDGNYTVFGRVLSGLEVLRQLEVGDEMTLEVVGSQ
ncbi:MAG: HEAT repeat domain-containing protein [Planctomycetes bacterium]|nr:HEAT repeat domain-containing protein [Planctomycetota bacterium]